MQKIKMMRLHENEQQRMRSQGRDDDDDGDDSDEIRGVRAHWRDASMDSEDRGPSPVHSMRREGERERERERERDGSGGRTEGLAQSAAILMVRL